MNKKTIEKLKKLTYFEFFCSKLRLAHVLLVNGNFSTSSMKISVFCPILLSSVGISFGWNSFSLASHFAVDFCILGGI